MIDPALSAVLLFLATCLLMLVFMGWWLDRAREVRARKEKRGTLPKLSKGRGRG